MERRSKRTALKEGSDDSVEDQNVNMETIEVADIEEPTSKRAKTVKETGSDVEMSVPVLGNELIFNILNTSEINKYKHFHNHLF